MMMPCIMLLTMLTIFQSLRGSGQAESIGQMVYVIVVLWYLQAEG